MCPGKGALLDGDIAVDVKAVERLSLPAHPARRAEDDVVREHVGEPVDVMGVEGFRALLESLAQVVVIEVPFR